MDTYIEQNGRRLRCGWTTGSCAAAAAKAAALLLLTGRRLDRVRLTTPRGEVLDLPISELSAGADWASAGVVKDAGDDPDVTDGALILARARRRPGPDIVIDGGEGVGRVTKPGLDQPVGAAAINSVPRRMIRQAVEEVRHLADEPEGLEITVSVPGGAAIAARTFNPRLGILGGISILGTTGIVEPMSERALADTVRTELRQRRAEGQRYALLTPGNYGADYLRDALGLEVDRAVLVSNFVGEALDECRALGFAGALLVGHLGKLVKLAGGMWNTHSKYGDCRMELMAAHAAACGLPPAETERLLDCAAVDEAVRVLDAAGLRGPVMERLAQRIDALLDHRYGPALPVGVLAFSKVHGEVFRTREAGKLLEFIVDTYSERL